MSYNLPENASQPMRLTGFAIGLVLGCLAGGNIGWKMVRRMKELAPAPELGVALRKMTPAAK